MGVNRNCALLSEKLPSMLPIIIEGDLLDQKVDVIINTWNRNIIPWWLLLPQGVSGAIKRKGGVQPFLEIGREGSIPLGGAVLTSAGKLPFKAIIHVAGINMLWRASTKSVIESCRSAMEIVNNRHFASAAFPIIGAGSGGFDENKALELMYNTLQEIDSQALIYIVKYRR